MSLKFILFLTTIFSFTSLLPATVAADEPPAEPTPRPLDELAERLKQGTENEFFFRENAHMVIIDLSELMAEDRLWEPIPIDPEQFKRFIQALTDMENFRSAHSTLPPNVFADAGNVEPLADPDNPEIPPVDILLLIDGDTSWETIVDPTDPQKQKLWKEFTQALTNMDWKAEPPVIQISLDENNQLICRRHWMREIPLDCTDTVHQMFSFMQTTKDLDLLKTVPARQEVEKFVSRELEDVKTVEQLRARIEQFLQQDEIQGLTFSMSIITTEIPKPVPKPEQQ